MIPWRTGENEGPWSDCLIGRDEQEYDWMRCVAIAQGKSLDEEGLVATCRVHPPHQSPPPPSLLHHLPTIWTPILPSPPPPRPPHPTLIPLLAHAPTMLHHTLPTPPANTPQRTHPNPVTFQPSSKEGQGNTKRKQCWQHTGGKFISNRVESTLIFSHLPKG